MTSVLKIITRLLAIMLCLSACSSEKQEPVSEGVTLVSVNDSTLTMSEVTSRIPSGLAPADSAALFRQIVDDWVRDMALYDFARNNVADIDRIDRMVREYRTNLIILAYLQNMTESDADDIKEERIRQYFEDNKENMILEEPIIKGAFLKVSAADPSIDNLRQWMSDFSDKSIDKIEEAGLKHVSTYKYFKDQWQAWSDVSQQIPYRFFDADAFVKSTGNFETSDAGSVYMLHISDYVLSGSEMPYEYARQKIKQILSSRALSDRKEKLVSDIYKQQIKKGVLKPGAYDPVSHQMVSPNYSE